MGSGEGDHLWAPVPGLLSDILLCTIMTFLWDIGYPPYEHWSIDSSGPAQVSMNVISPFNNKIWFFRLLSPWMAYCAPLVWALKFLLEEGRSRSTGPVQFH